MDLKTFIVLCH